MNETDEFIEKVNNKLNSIIDYAENELIQEKLIESMKYSLFAGGKRIRPILVYEFCKMCNGDTEKAVAPAAAVEAIHTYSLIHDDLPAMDNDDFRRGKPSNHKKFGEYTAILAGDALNTLAFEIIAGDENLSDDVKTTLIRDLSRASGFLGMVGGQQMDIELESSNNANADDLAVMYTAKTGALISSACRMGAESAKAPDFLVRDAGIYGMYMGIAYQIIDDILDITGNSEKLGKPVGSDAESNKHTYAVLAGLDKAKERAEYYSKKAIEILDVFPENEYMKEFTENLLRRDF